MALIYDSDPIEATWSTALAQNQHVATIRVSNFVANTYYDMIAELKADPGLPNFANGPDPAVAGSNLRFVRWEAVDFACGEPTPTMTIRMYYETQSFGITIAANKDGPVIFRQRATQIDDTYIKDRFGALNEVVYKGDEKTIPWTTQRSLWLFECERYEDENPFPRASPILDKVNSVAWNGFASRTVQFVDFQSDTRDDNTTWLCFYTFLYRSDGHDPELVWTNDQGQVPKDIDANPTATINPEILAETSFGPLNITLP